MAEYPYSPELKKPLAAGDVDFLDPKTQKTLETVMKIFQFQAKIVIAPSGVRKSRQEYPAENGDRLPYLLSAPKNNTQKLPAIIYYHGGAPLPGAIRPKPRHIAANRSLEDLSVLPNVYGWVKLKSRCSVPNEHRDMATGKIAGVVRGPCYLYYHSS